MRDFPVNIFSSFLAFYERRMCYDVLMDNATEKKDGRGRPKEISDALIGRVKELVDTKGLSISEASSRFDIPRTTISYRLKAGGAPGRKKALSKSDIEMIKKKRAKGAGADQLAIEFGVSVNTIRRHW